MTAPKLEDFRDEQPVGRFAYTYRGSDPRPALWHENAQNAFYITIDALNAFQRIHSLGGNSYLTPAIGLWILAAESYVSMHYKVAQEDDAYALQAGSLRGPPRRLSETAKAAEKLVAVDEFYGGRADDRELLRREFVEFLTLRNMVFHDLTTARRPTFKHTTFPTRVENVIETDLLQAAIIATNVFSYFRHIFPTADLMPSVVVGATAEKVDVLIEEVVPDVQSDP